MQEMPGLWAEENLTWLMIQHTSDPRRLEQRLRTQMHSETPENKDKGTLLPPDWLSNPFLREGIEIVPEIMPPA